MMKEFANKKQNNSDKELIHELRETSNGIDQTLLVLRNRIL